MKKFLTLLFVATVFAANSQVTFSNDKAKFIKELQTALSNTGNPDHIKFVKNDLNAMLIVRNEMPDRYFSQLIATCNVLATKRFSVYPDIYNYVFSVYSLVLNKQSESSYNAFQSTVDKLLESKNPKRFTDFSDVAAGFFFERRLAQKSNFEWSYDGGKYEFKYEDKPLIVLTEGNLICRAIDVVGSTRKTTKYTDSIVIIGAKGIYDPTLQRWDGTSGKITWEKVGLKKDETFATIKRHQISMKNTNVNIDSVVLKTPLMKEEMMGTLSERAFKISREDDRIYPQFISYNPNVKINNIKPNINYEGSFSLRGANFVGIGVKNNLAKITVIKNGKPFVTSRSTEVIISNEKVFCSASQNTILLNTGDSITHPSTNFTYLLGDQTLEFARYSSGLGQAPFSDSYHKLDFYLPKIIIKSKDNLMLFTYEKGTSQEQKIARFESNHYYDAELYNKLQGLSTVHPLVAIDKYTYKYDKYVLTEGECATALGGSLEQVRPLMLQLAVLGFISYDTENKKVIINKKLEHFVKGNAGKQDYDNIAIVSDFRPKELKGYSDADIKKDESLKAIAEQYKAQNEQRRLYENFGTFNLSTMDIDILGVDKITLSASQNVHIFPKDFKIKIKQNRDLEFAGWVNIGKVEVNTLTANYNYADNKINLIKTDQSYIRASPLEATHGTQGIAMITALNNIVGDVIIDLPTNRSGNRKDATTAKFPVLSVKNPSKVYYNEKSLYNGAYDSTRFYYAVQPFEIDSVDNFNDKALRLKGELVSAGIFPVIKEDLKIMPDYSFGFSTAAPKEGFNFYGTGAKYENKVMLSGRGLQGSGTIQFVKSTSVSKNLFTFLPDSTIGLVKFTNEAVANGIQFPDSKCEEAYMTYIPKKKVLKASSTQRYDIEYFSNEAKLRGTAMITPEGMTGRGLMTFKNATMVSQHYVYKHTDLYADTSSFNLKNENKEEGEAPLIFETNNVKSHVSFKDRKGLFNSNHGESRVSFPVNQYMCKMDMFTWFMDQDQIDMEKSASKDLAITSGVDLLGPNFYSTHPKQDSLQFRAPKAKLNMREKTIYCNEVQYIDVADARIFPDSMKVTVRKKAQLDQFTNATIIANYITKYHKFEEVTANITARRAYTASGKYPYYDKDSVPAYIIMNNIKLDSSYQTVATGQVDQTKEFKLSEEFDFYGTLMVRASTPEILFSGATRINHSCEKFERNWLAFSSSIDPKKIQIPVSSKMKNLDGQPISAGIVWRDASNVDSLEMYPTFLSALSNPNDPIVITSSGLLTYDYDTKEFQIASKEKLINRSAPGNYLALNTQTCSMLGDGVVNLGMDHGDVKMESVGTVDYNQKTGNVDFNLTTKMYIPIDKNILKDIPEKINATSGLNSMDFVTNTLKSAMSNWGNPNLADKLEEDFTIKGELKKIPSQLESTFTFTGLRMSYYNKPDLNNFKGLITNVESVVLVSIYDKPVMKYVPFQAFFQQKYSNVGGDWFAFLIDIPGGKDYFFNYTMGKKEGIMDIMTGDNELSSSISSLKDDKRKTKNFIYQLGQGGLKTVFNNLFR